MGIETEKPAKKFNWFTMFWEGFTHMTQLGKTLWILVIIKLIIMFVILKPFFFHNYIKSNYETKQEQEAYMQNTLIDRSTIDKE